jgi:hypothetical protein
MLPSELQSAYYDSIFLCTHDTHLGLLPFLILQKLRYDSDYAYVHDVYGDGDDEQVLLVTFLINLYNLT